jgi:hypothetical protein
MLLQPPPCIDRRGQVVRRVLICPAIASLLVIIH